VRDATRRSNRINVRLSTTVAVVSLGIGLAGAWALRAIAARAAVVAPTGAALGRLPAGERPSDLNLLVVTLDTTRADAMGAYGAPDAATPAFDRIARDGVLFERAITAAPLTLPAHASLFTARYPPAHGVRDNGGFVLDEKETTLAERLRARGFRTGGFVGAFVLDRRWGIAQGFDTYVDAFDASKAGSPVAADLERRGDQVADRALAWLETAASSRFFAWVHFYDAHTPYDPPEPYRSRFASRPYAGEVAFVDAQVQRLVGFLERRDLLKRTIVAVVGDHGESLGEHGESTHGFFAYDAVLRVPLAILTPYESTRARRVRAVVRTVDLTPTVLDLLGIPMGGAADGRTLAPLLSGASSDLALEAYSETMFARYHFGWSELRALTSDRYKFIEAPRPELYDLQQDPGERQNLFAARTPLAERMAASLRTVGADRAAGGRAPAPIDAEARARLAALGYVGTFVDDARARSGLADPKDKIELFNLLTDARMRLQAGADADAGVAILKRITRQDPDVVDAWLLLGNEHARRRQYARAVASFRRALALKPDYTLAAMNLAHAYRDLGQRGEAAKSYAAILDRDPADIQARQELAGLLVEDGRLDSAERELRAVLERQPGAPLAHFNLALVCEQRGDLPGAVAEYRREIAGHPDSYQAQFNLGKVYERLGDREAERTAYEASIASNPRFAEGHLFLAKLHLDARRLDEAAREAQRGLELGGASEWAPLGHFVLADVYALRGRREDSARESAEGRRLAARAKK
jgi:arylsulfatase A-like enzyme/Tfp pilus assembly protein PilF